MQKWVCCVCGIGPEEKQIDRAHVRQRTEFSHGENHKHMNIIPMCSDRHHKLFDVRGTIGITDIDPSKEIHFVRFNHCFDGYCVTKSKSQIRNLFISMNTNKDGMRIKWEYIDWKNEQMKNQQLLEFTKSHPPIKKYRICTSPET